MTTPAQKIERMSLETQVVKANKREVLRAIYLDWINNYLTTSAFADHNGLTDEQARKLVDLAREVFSSPHPDA